MDKLFTSRVEVDKMVMTGQAGLVISKLLGGEPIDINLPVPVAISDIANIATAEPGEDIYKYASLITDADEVKTIDANGVITASKVTLKGKTALSFTGLSTDKLYVLIDELLSSPHQTVFSQKRKALIRGMDKIELRLMLKLVMDDSDVVTITPISGEDLWDVCVRAKQALEDYGDIYKMLVGSALKNHIDTYTKEKAATFQYNVAPGGLKKYLESIDISVRKIFGIVKYTGDVSAQRLLDTDKFVLVATDSTIADIGKPLWFVRRKFNSEIAKLMDANIDEAQRALFVDPAPTPVTNTSVLGFGVFAYESIVMANTNYKAIVKSADLSSIY